ncbi:MAG: hypothetical protein K8J08_06565 [Thermoanaerobaculia bacterium]|nr:hypothetical protein [Thermoanaerobaculia bacterium]
MTKLAFALLLIGSINSAQAASNPTVIAMSFDQHARTVTGILADEDVLLLDAAHNETLLTLGLPADVDLDAYGVSLSGTAISVGTTTLIGSIVVEPGDVLLMTPGGNSLLFDASAAGLVDADVDALTFDDNDLLILSFANAIVDSFGAIAENEDIVYWLGGDLWTVIDGSAEGIPESANIDGLHWDSAGSRLWISFDTTVRIGGLVADDEDILAFEPGWGWQEILDVSAVLPGSEALDIDALWGQSVDAQLLFRDGFESGSTSAWSSSP